MFVLSYFRTEAEALHLAVSDDGYAWESLNDDEPVLRGEVGTESLRDPFLFRDRGDTYHMLATDSWSSEYIVHAESDDLRSWSEQELVPVMADVPGARNSWAPECYYDRAADVYRLVWSSTVSRDGPEDLRDHRIWSCATPDFEEFDASASFFDPGYNVIDACVAYDEAAEEYLMAFKDERGENSLNTDYKAIRTCRAPSGGGPFRDISDPVTPAPVEGPALYRADGEWLMLYDHFIEDRYGASRSVDGDEWTVCTDEMTFPEGVRHGSVLEVPDGVGRELRETF